jgi:hypothetical protein
MDLYVLLSQRVGEMAHRSAPGVVGLLAWWDPTGKLWIAPLGSPPPAEPMPFAWLPVNIEHRTDLI